jgi:diguanylate cyclase (GGDEF)-like protein
MDFATASMEQRRGLRAMAQACLDQTRGGLACPAELEALYQRETGPDRARYLRIVAGIGALLLGLYALLDAVVMRDVFTLVIIDQALAMAAILAIGSKRFREKIPRPAQESGALAACLICMFCALINLFLSHSGYARLNFFLLAPNLVYAVLVCQLRFRDAVIYTTITMASLCGALALRGDFSIMDRIYPAQYTLMMAGPALFISYRLEKSSRRDFLLALMQKLLIEDLSAERAMLDELSATDPLTGAANRRRLDMALTSLRDRPGVAFMLIDVDHFKAFNDQHGHVAGDQCLREVATAMTGQLRAGTDLLARFGGEEFAVLLQLTDAEGALASAERLRATVEAHRFALAGALHGVTVSVGVALACADLVDAADKAMYVAKRAGRNRVHAAWMDIEPADEPVHT